MLLIKFTLNVDVYFNGVWIGTSAPAGKPVNWNRPFHFHIPGELWQAQRNELLVHLRTEPDWGLLAPILLGSVEQVQSEYERRFFNHITVNQVAFFVTLMISAIAAILWVSNRRQSHNGWFALSALFWSVVAFNYFSQTYPLSIPWWSVVFHASLDAFSACLFIFSTRFLALQSRLVRRIEKLVFLYWLASVVTYFTCRVVLETAVPMILHLPYLLTGALSLGFGIKHWWHERTMLLAGFCLSFAALLVFALHDSLFARAMLAAHWLEQAYLMQLASPVVLTLLLLMLASAYVKALRAAERANAMLEQRIFDATNELEASYAAQQKIAQERAVLDERQRIYQDLHDDIGAKLLSLIYAAVNDEQRALARAALEDLRSIVRRVENEAAPEPTDTVVARWHEEAASRCAQAGISLQWQSPEALPELPAPVQYHLTQVLRELISNVIKHADAGHLSVLTSVQKQPDAAVLSIQVRDDGHGCLPALLPAVAPSHSTNSGGAGRAVVLRRVQHCGGTVTWGVVGDGERGSDLTAARAQGTEVTVHIPLR